MSLINQMLRDLETRRADSSEKTSLPNEVRPLPSVVEPHPLQKPALTLAALGVLALLAWWLTGMSRSAPESTASAEADKSAATAHHDVALKIDPDLANARVQQPSAAKTNVLPKVTPAPSIIAINPPGQKNTASTRPIETPAETRGNDGRPAIEKRPPGGDVTATPLQRAREQLGSGQRDAAEATLRQALGANAGHVAMRQMLTALLIEQRRNDEALVVLKEGLSLHPDQTQWAINAARIQVDGNDLDGAWDTLQGSLPYAGNQADYRAFCGTVLSRMKRHGEAVEHYRAALALNPGEGRWWVGLALALDADGKASEARSAFASAKASGKLTPEMSAYVDNKLR